MKNRPLTLATAGLTLLIGLLAAPPASASCEVGAFLCTESGTDNDGDWEYYCIFNTGDARAVCSGLDGSCVTYQPGNPGVQLASCQSETCVDLRNDPVQCVPLGLPIPYLKCVLETLPTVSISPLAVDYACMGIHVAP